MSSRGLEGVVVAETRLSKIYGEEGRLIYSGYEIEDLAENTTFEEVCHLLWYGALPNRRQLDALRSQLAAERTVHPDLIQLLRMLPADTHPMAALRTAASALASYDPESEDMSREANLRKAIRITAKLPTLTAAFDRLRRGKEPVEPRSDLSHAANFLYMLHGAEPGELEARIIDAALILHAEHGMNASTFSARVTVATLSDMHSGVTSAIGTLKGPLHGGANERVMRMLQEIGEPDNVEGWIRSALDRKERIMGFGHRVYRALDPRAPILKRLAEELSGRGGNTKWLEISERIQSVMAEEMERRGKKVYPNVDFFSASVYYTLGIPTDLFTNVFACARAAGWTAHIIEQYEDNRLIRPKAEYVGPMGLTVRPIDERP
ncbi:MAG TPA: citrate synthase [Longimicrobiales bacterium]